MEKTNEIKTVRPETAFLRGLKELKVKELPEVRREIMDALGVTTPESFRNYAGGRHARLDVAKARRIEEIFARHGVSNCWGN